MRKLIVQEWISLDGNVEDKNGKLDFFTELSGEENKYADQDQLHWLESVDTILLGRKTYELFVDFWPGATVEQEVIADALNATAKLVFSNSLTQAPWGKWPAATVVSGEAADTIRDLKTQPGKDMVLWGSIQLVQSLMKQGLVDELHLHICPTVTGGGRRFFQEQDQYATMTLIDLKKYDTGVIYSRYQPK